MELTITFLESKLKEAEKAIMLYTTLLDELRKVQGELKLNKTNNNFLKVVTNKGDNYEN